MFSLLVVDSTSRIGERPGLRPQNISCSDLPSYRKVDVLLIMTQLGTSECPHNAQPRVPHDKPMNTPKPTVFAVKREQSATCGIQRPGVFPIGLRYWKSVTRLGRSAPVVQTSQ
jgi:hypothetical protein